MQTTGTVSRANAYRNPYISSVDTNALTVQTASLDLLAVAFTSAAQGPYLNAATAQEPVVVLGAAAAQRLAIDRVFPGERIWIGGQWSYGAGIHNRQCSPLPSTLPSWSATPRRRSTWASTTIHPATVYLRAQNDRVNAVDNLLAETANPENPSEVNVRQPSAALVAQADAKSALNGLFLGQGAVALLVGAVGMANIMVISVLERRSRGLRGTTAYGVPYSFDCFSCIQEGLAGTAAPSYGSEGGWGLESLRARIPPSALYKSTSQPSLGSWPTCWVRDLHAARVVDLAREKTPRLARDIERELRSSGDR